MHRSRFVRSALTAATTTVVAAGLAVVAAGPSAAAAPKAARLAHNISGSSAALRSTLLNRAAGHTLPAGVPHHGSYAFLLQLRAPSTSDVFAATKASRGTRAASVAAHSQLRAVDAMQSRVISRLPANSTVDYRVHAVMNGVAVYTDVHNYAKLAALSDVTAIYPIAPKKPDNAYAVPFQNAPHAWTAYGDRGEGVSIAVIDTGVDYTHANFGGPGTIAAYKAARARDTKRVAAGSYDPAKFDATTMAHGKPEHFYDFAGDAYNPARAATSTPHPDPNPLDCGEHGSHVAGTAAGFGENADGSTFTGTYDDSIPFDSMRIGPGMAPKATIWAYKVFGCKGSTNVVGAALDKAMDPNGDGSTADHADVISMSLGSDYGSPQDGDSVLSDRAVKAGAVVVAAAGNAGDVYDVGGSPADAPRVIAAASSVDAQNVVDSLFVGAPASIKGRYAAMRSVAYHWRKGPDLKGQVIAPSDPNNQDGCQPFTKADKARVAGKIVFEEWVGNDALRPCGSTTRAANLEKTKAVGFIFGDDEEPFPGGFVITGSAKIPGVLASKTAADAIRDQLQQNQTVKITGTQRNNFKQTSTSVNDTLSTFSSRDIRSAGNVKPDITAVGDTVTSTHMGTGNGSLNISGTSMATPMVSGAAALVVGQHRAWRPQQVKADLMNTADHDLYTGNNHTGAKYGPNRVGSGRLDVGDAVDNTVLAYTADGGHGTTRGVVSASFGPLAFRVASGKHVLRKKIRVQNTGSSAQKYNASFAYRTRIPGAAYSVSPSTMTVAPHSTRIATLTLTVHPRSLTKTIDPTVSRDDEGLPRQYVADVSGIVRFVSTSGAPTLRVPAYAAPRPASNMTQTHRLRLPKGAVQQAVLRLRGSRVLQGYGEDTVDSIVAGFELQGISGKAPHCTAKVQTRCVAFSDERAADLKYVGSTSDAPQQRSLKRNAYNNGLAYFAITTQGPWRTAVGLHNFTVFIDGNGDGKADAVLTTLTLPDSAGADSDIPVAALFDYNTGDLLTLNPINDVFGDVDTALFDSDTMILPVDINAIPGVTPRHGRINYVVTGSTGYHNGSVDSIGRVNHGVLHNGMSMNVLHPGLAVFGSYSGQGSALLYEDSPSAVLDVRRDAKQYTRDHGLGLLMLHLHNTLANKAQRVSLTTR